MPDSIARECLKEVKPLNVSDPVGSAARKVVESGLPALPVVDDGGRFAGIFGEREFIGAVFPGYVGTLASARMVSRSLDETIEWRSAEEPIAGHLTTDAIVVAEDFSDIQLAETFLHHRVLIVPVAKEGRIYAVITRADFFKALAAKVGEQLEDLGD